jgi:hypothetical protein
VRLLNFTLFLSKRFNFFLPLIYVIRFKGIFLLEPRPNSSPNSSNILIVSKTGLVEDFKTISQHEDNDFNFFVLNRKVADIIAKGFLPKDQIGDYLTNDNYSIAHHLNLQRFWVKLFCKLNSFYDFKVLVSGSWVYWNERDFHEALVTLKIPVVVLYKEAVASKVASEYLIAKYNSSRPFIGDLLLVYSEAQRQRVIAGKISTEEKTRAVGSPRFDVLLRKKDFTTLEYSEDPHFRVVFFLHDDFIGSSDTSFNPVFSHIFAKAREDLIDIAVQLAFDNHDILVTIKTKVTLTTISSVKKIEEMLPLLPNLKFVYGGIATDSLSDARVTVAFNSTSTLDSVAAGIETILFRPSYCQNYLDLLIDFGDDLEVCYTNSDLSRALLSKYLKFPEYSSYNEDFKFRILNKFVGNGDGKASGRVLDELRKLCV